MTARERATRVFRKMADPTITLGTKINLFLSELATVQYQAVISSFLAFGTATVYWTCMLKKIEIDPVNFGMWLGFVAAYGGIQYKSFKTKRETYKPEIQSTQNQQGNITDEVSP